MAYKLKLSESELINEVKVSMPKIFDSLTLQVLGFSLQNYDGLIVRSDTKITAKILDAGNGHLKVVGRAGVGVDNIDIPAATKNNVIVLK